MPRVAAFPHRCSCATEPSSCASTHVELAIRYESTRYPAGHKVHRRRGERRCLCRHERCAFIRREHRNGRRALRQQRRWCGVGVHPFGFHVDPGGEKLTGSGESGRATFGRSVALSSDGNTALIGGPSDNSGAGAVWAFTRSGSSWTQQGEKLTSGESGQVQFGSSVALSSDGNTALIGGIYAHDFAGAAWVFIRSGSAWTHQGAALTGSGESGEGIFGSSVAISADGNTALIGAPGDNGRIGAAWVFARSGSTWAQQGEKLIGSGESREALFGSGVALSSDGDTALIGGPTDNSNAGAAWVFTRSASTWTQQGAKLTAGGGVYLGNSVTLSADGDIALVGASRANSYRGAAWVLRAPAEPGPHRARNSPAALSAGTLASARLSRCPPTVLRP